MTDKEFALRHELEVSMFMLDEVIRLLQSTEPNARLLNLHTLIGLLHSHIKLLRDMLPKHGTTSEFQKGCRCEPCRKAKADYNKMYKKVKGKK